MSGAGFVLGVLFLTIVAPLWIIGHYLIRWRSARALSTDDEQQMAGLRDAANRMEQRIANLERILAADAANTEEPR